MLLAVAFTHTHGWAALLFPGGVRLSTWLTLAAFAAISARRRELRPLAAGAAWFLGFEAAYQATALATGNGLPAAGASAEALVAIGAAGATLAWRRRIRPAPSFALVTVAVWIAWVVVGFPANDATLAGFDPLAEALNEAAKTLWALAYLLPLWKLSSRMPATIRAAGPPVTTTTGDA